LSRAGQFGLAGPTGSVKPEHSWMPAQGDEGARHRGIAGILPRAVKMIE